jgi:DNA polymerase elongation subunit (family B)
MLDEINIDDVLFLDIETVPGAPDFESLPDKMKELWTKKAGQIGRNDPDQTPEELYKRAGIYAEFGKIVCISCGFINGNGFRVRSFYGEDEKMLLNDFGMLLNRSYTGTRYLLCGHNSKEFDIPYIARRMLVNGIKLPEILNVAGKKPWEVRHIDTMDLWKFGDYKHFTSLELLATIFNIPTPKDDIDGSQVGEVYWKEKDLKRIAKYCEKDVFTTAQLLRRYLGMPLIKPEFVVSV